MNNLIPGQNFKISEPIVSKSLYSQREWFIDTVPTEKEYLDKNPNYGEFTYTWYIAFLNKALETGKLKLIRA